MNIKFFNKQSSIKIYTKIITIFKIYSYRLEKSYFSILLFDKSIRVILHLNNLTVHGICG